ncbi:MAG: response regulator [Elusimicrobia bacterium]|nr:response regulator [Elusimicrobiota bacterium]
MAEGGLAPAGDKLILVIEDDESSRELMETILKREGFRCATAFDGQQGLDKAQSLAPDLIMLDMMLPKFHGVQIVRMLQTGSTSGIPVLIVTGHGGERNNEEQLRKEPNVKGYYEKPVNAMALGMTLHMLLKTKPPMTGKPPAW